MSHHADAAHRHCTRRVLAALDATPSRIPGAARRLRQRPHDAAAAAARSARPPASQYIDVERTATTPERFLRAIAAASPFPSADSAAAGARAAFDATLAFFDTRPRRQRRAGDVPARRIPRAAHVRKLPGPAPRAARARRRRWRRSGNRFVLTSRYTARALRLLRDRSARFEVIHMPPLTVEDTLDIARGRPGGLGERRARRRVRRAHGAGARRRPPGLRPRLADELDRDARARAAADAVSALVALLAPDGRLVASRAASATSCGCTARAATAR